MITLYHGTNCDITRPNPRKGSIGTDFGQGFYLTPDMESARRMASAVCDRMRSGTKTIHVYEFDEESARIAGLSIRTFKEMDLDWVSFIIANRLRDQNAADHNLDALYDVVKGFTADDRIRLLMRNYSAGLLNENILLEKLQERPWRVMQYSFHTARAVKFLKLKEVWHEQ